MRAHGVIRLLARGALMAASAGLSLASFGAAGQSYPAKPIQFLIGFAVGGSSDVVSRLVAERLAAQMGQPVVPVNRPTAGGVIAYQTVAKAPPDGYTLVLLTSAHPIAGVLQKDLPYDPVKDFAMVSLVTAYPLLITVASDSPYRSFNELLDAARKQPGRITYAIAGPASGHRLLGELIQLQARVDMAGVPFKGAAQAMIDLLGGRISAMVETATFSLPQVKSGKMRALAVSTATRYAYLPDVPAINEAAPGVDYTSWLGLATSPGTSDQIVNRLNREIGEMLKDGKFLAQLERLGGVGTPSTPTGMRDRVMEDMASWKRVIEIRKISID